MPKVALGKRQHTHKPTTALIPALDRLMALEPAATSVGDLIAERDVLAGDSPSMSAPCPDFRSVDVASADNQRSFELPAVTATLA